uniref:Uncharacterized protein n=1 Tax=Gossypium raimondii TaxID=29730 RepID=A0A0D2REC9_GOSRA|nr:hypothetical protein B456_008G126100 [Gossypium raimondii]
MRENRTTSRLEKGMGGPLLAQRVRGRPERHHQWNLLTLLVKKSFIYLISSEADNVHVSLLTTFFSLFLDAMFNCK